MMKKLYIIKLMNLFWTWYIIKLTHIKIYICIKCSILILLIISIFFFNFSQFCHQKCECCFSEKMKIEIRFYSKFSQIFSLLSLFWLTKFDRIFFKWFQFVRNNVWSSVLILIVEFDFWKWTRCWNSQCTSFCMSIFNLTNFRLNPHHFVVMSSRENSIDRNLNLIFLQMNKNNYDTDTDDLKT